jgi:hypothetical protein
MWCGSKVGVLQKLFNPFCDVKYGIRMSSLRSDRCEFQWNQAPSISLISTDPLVHQGVYQTSFATEIVFNCDAA